MDEDDYIDEVALGSYFMLRMEEEREVSSTIMCMHTAMHTAMHVGFVMFVIILLPIFFTALPHHVMITQLNSLHPHFSSILLSSSSFVVTG